MGNPIFNGINAPSCVPSMSRTLQILSAPSLLSTQGTSGARSAGALHKTRIVLSCAPWMGPVNGTHAARLRRQPCLSQVPPPTGTSNPNAGKTLKRPRKQAELHRKTGFQPRMGGARSCPGHSL